MKASSRRRALAATLLAGLAWVAGCTAGGGGFVGEPEGDGIQASFAATAPDPGAPAVAMTAGEADGAAFDVEIRVQSVAEFFGAAFRVAFDPRWLSFVGSSSADSFIVEEGVATEFLAVPGEPGVLIVTASRRGQVAGVSAGESGLLMTLSFRLEGPTSGQAVAFGPLETRQVTTCPAPPDACRDVPDAEIAWTGGTAYGN